MSVSWHNERVEKMMEAIAEVFGACSNATAEKVLATADEAQPSGAAGAMMEAYEYLTDADSLGPNVTETAVEAARMVLFTYIAGIATDRLADEVIAWKSARKAASESDSS